MLRIPALQFTKYTAVFTAIVCLNIARGYIEKDILEYPKEIICFTIAFWLMIDFAFWIDRKIVHEKNEK
jgi:hypothetical protein